MTDGYKISSGMGLSSLIHEPIRLSNEADKCNEELEELVMANYRIFVENLTCSVELRKEDQKLAKVSAELGERLEKLSGFCSSFRERVSVLVSSHKRNRKTLQHHMQLVELLEVPQLVDACARNDFLDEALELAHFVNGLERRQLIAEGLKTAELLRQQQGRSDLESLQNTPDINQLRGGDVIGTIVSDVRHTLLNMRTQLVAQFSKQSSLPKTLSVLSTLRKLDGILIDQQIAQANTRQTRIAGELSDQQREHLRAGFVRSCETRLQMEFLEGRSLWVQTQLSAGMASDDSMHEVSDTQHNLDKASAPTPAHIPSSSASSLGPYGRAIEMLEISRTTWFEVVTQFKALFSEDQTSSATVTKNSPTENCADDGVITPTVLLSAWVSAHVGILLVNLETLCQNIDEGAALRVVLEQGLYFGQRMAHVGCNLNAALIPMFERIIVRRIDSQLDFAVRSIQQMLETERYQPHSHSGSSTRSRDHETSNQLSASELSAAREQVVPLYVRHTAAGDVARELLTPSGKRANMNQKEIPTPHGLSAFPPLAFLTNALLSCLNLLRECPLISARGLVSDKLKNTLVHVCTLLVSCSSHIREKGILYLRPTTGSVADKHSVGKDHLDRMYACALAQDVLPHCLICFDSVYDETSYTSSADERPPASVDAQTPIKAAVANTGTKAATLHVERVMDAQSFLSKESFKILLACWTILTDSALIADAPFTPSPVPQK